MKENLKRLLKLSYVPISKFKVSAIIVDENNNKYFGVNIENPSFKDGLCAEQVALNNYFTKRKSEAKIKEINIMSSNKDKYITPCFLCRQILSEVCDSNVVVNCYNNKGDFKSYTIAELCPYPFGKESLR